MRDTGIPTDVACGVVYLSVCLSLNHVHVDMYPAKTKHKTFTVGRNYKYRGQPHLKGHVTIEKHYLTKTTGYRYFVARGCVGLRIVRIDRG